MRATSDVRPTIDEGSDWIALSANVTRRNLAGFETRARSRFLSHKVARSATEKPRLLRVL